MRHYGILAKPLTELTKKEKSQWSVEAEVAFQNLKQAMSSAQLPDFSKVFILETDASYSGLGVEHMQEHHPITSLSKALAKKYAEKLDNELAAITGYQSDG